MYTETLAPKTKSVFGKLSQGDAVKSFYLSGGTALALHLGHRESEDLDFFTKEEFNPQLLQRQLEKSFKLSGIALEADMFNCYVDGVKLQFLHYPYKLISEPATLDGIEISSIADIACTKLITVSARGSKKDFIDLFFILQKFSLSKLFELLTKKYSQVDYNLLHILKSLVCFDTAEDEPMPKMHKAVSWIEVKKFMVETTKNFKI